MLIGLNEFLRILNELLMELKKQKYIDYIKINAIT